MSKIRMKANGVIMDTPVSDMEDMRSYDNAGIVVASSKKGRKKINRVMRFYFNNPDNGQSKEEMLADIREVLNNCIREKVFPPPKRGKWNEPEIKELEYVCVKERAHGKFGFSYEYAELFIDRYVDILNKYNNEGTLDPENNYDEWKNRLPILSEVLRGLVVADPHYGVCSGEGEQVTFNKERMRELFGFDPSDPEDREKHWSDGNEDD